VVGGERIHWHDVFAQGSSGAAIYVAAEKSYDTFGNADISFDGGLLRESNLNPEVEQAAVMVYSDQPGHPSSGITFSNIQIEGVPHSPAVALLAAGGAQVDRVSLDGLEITDAAGGPLRAELPESSYNTSNWTVDGQPLADHTGW
jgi:hypothetical protein